MISYFPVRFSLMRLFMLLALAAAACGGVSGRAVAATVDNVRIGVHPGKTRIVFDVEGVEAFRAFAMADPYRIAIDAPSFDWRVGTVSRPPGSIVRGIRQGILTGGVSRIVVDLDGPAQIESAFILPGANGKGGPARLVIDVSPVAAGAFPAAAGKVFGALRAETPAPAPQPQALGGSVPETPRPPPSRPMADDSADDSADRAWTGPAAPPPKPASAAPAEPAAASRAGDKPLIVIDPGHGGIDPGALGANGAFEKNVSLGMAKTLKAKLEASGRYRVLLTRDGDTYLKLRQRVEFARARKADLFISLHADSVGRSGVQGASVYTLSEKASDEQTAKLAARENRADLIGGLDVGDQDDEQVAGILVDLVMRDNMNQSRFLANTMVGEMRGQGLRLLENPHRSAGFAVLKSPDIPSMLVEMGFMTNAAESAKLTSPDYRDKVSAALMRGIDAYFGTVGRLRHGG